MILALMLSESVLIALLGGALAAIAAKVIYQFVGMGEMMALFLQNFKIRPAQSFIALGASALIGLVSGGIPAWNAARISIVDGLATSQAIRVLSFWFLVCGLVVEPI